MKIFLWRLLLIIGMALAGLLIVGVSGGVFLVPKDAGLAGGPMIVGYGVLGAVVFAIGGTVAVLRLGEPGLRRAALIVAVSVLVGFVALIGFIVLKTRADDARQTGLLLPDAVIGGVRNGQHILLNA